jgi:hypothetical protein
MGNGTCPPTLKEYGENLVSEILAALEFCLVLIIPPGTMKINGRFELTSDLHHQGPSTAWFACLLSLALSCNKAIDLYKLNGVISRKMELLRLTLLENRGTSGIERE